MRTTVILPDALIAAVKDRAARDGRTMTSVIEEALRDLLERGPLRRPVDALPVWGDKDDEFLVDLYDKDAVERVLDGDRDLA